MQKQAVALRDNFGFDACIVDVIKWLWFALLPRTTILEPTFSRHGPNTPYPVVLHCLTSKGVTIHGPL
jgi:hypothetical protein